VRLDHLLSKEKRAFGIEMTIPEGQNPRSDREWRKPFPFEITRILALIYFNKGS
jgi:hypothetical protein